MTHGTRQGLQLLGFDSDPRGFFRVRPFLRLFINLLCFTIDNNFFTRVTPRSTIPALEGTLPLILPKTLHCELDSHSFPFFPFSLSFLFVPSLFFSLSFFPSYASREPISPQLTIPDWRQGWGQGGGREGRRGAAPTVPHALKPPPADTSLRYMAEYSRH